MKKKGWLAKHESDIYGCIAYIVFITAFFWYNHVPTGGAVIVLFWSSVAITSWNIRSSTEEIKDEINKLREEVKKSEE